MNGNRYLARLDGFGGFFGPHNFHPHWGYDRQSDVPLKL